MRSKKCRLCEETGSAPAEFVFVLGPTLLVASMMVVMSVFAAQSAVLRLDTLQQARRASAADASSPLPGTMVTRSSSSGLRFVEVFTSQVFPMSFDSLTLRDSQVMPDQSVE